MESTRNHVRVWTGTTLENLPLGKLERERDKLSESNATYTILSAVSRHCIFSLFHSQVAQRSCSASAGNIAIEEQNIAIEHSPLKSVTVSLPEEEIN